MVLPSQILFSLAIAAIAEAILMRMSAKLVPSLHKVASNYLKLVTSSNFWPFMLTAALILLCFGSRPCSFLSCLPFHVSVSLLVRSWSSPLLLPIRLMSSANHRLHMGPPPMEMDGVKYDWHKNLHKHCPLNNFLSDMDKAAMFITDHGYIYLFMPEH